jgi:hypothetical protein
MRDSDGTIYVLEDNLRVPSGVSYMIENREVTKRVLPELFENNTILPVDDYPDRLLERLQLIGPPSLPGASPAVPSDISTPPGNGADAHRDGAARQRHPCRAGTLTVRLSQSIQSHSSPDAHGPTWHVICCISCQGHQPGTRLVAAREGTRN